MNILNTIDDALNSWLSLFQSKQTVWVAYSGGVDSHVLLHALVQLRNKRSKFHLKAIHIHHGLLPKADDWLEHCQSVCNILNVDIVDFKLQLKPQSGDSIEAIARQARYQKFSQTIEKDEIIVTAHHADDQAETFLLQLFRGAGLKGLSSIAVKMPFDSGTILRPFLHVSRDDILVYAKAHHLIWIEDDSNTNTRFLRNFLRREAIPLLKTKWPHFDKTLVRAATHITEADKLLSEFIGQDVAKVVKEDGSISLEKLKNFSFIRQKNILRYWVYENNFLLPQEKQLNHVFKDVIDAREDAIPCVCWDGAEVRRYQNHLYLMKPLLPMDATMSFQWNYQQPLEFPHDLGTLIPKVKKGQGMKLSKLPKSLTVSFRQGGEVIELQGRKGRQDLKKLFQEWKIPPWMRDCIPLIYVNNELVCVVGYAISRQCQTMPDDLGLNVLIC